jgi:hypothetical protein
MNDGIYHIREALTPLQAEKMPGRLWVKFWVLLALFLYLPFLSIAQDDQEFYEISLFLDIKHIGAIDLPSVINGQQAYLSISDLFNFLKINNTPSIGFETITGFFIDPKAVFTISRADNTIEYNGKLYQLNKDDLLRTETNLYLHSKYFGEIFGLNCVFDFRNLKITLNTDIELPAIREQQQKNMRENLNAIKGDFTADSTIKRNYPLLSFGMFDWSVNSTQYLNKKTSTQVNLAVGSVFAGGETNIGINYNTTQAFTNRQIFYRWRYANNDNKAIKQVLAGKINSYSISSIYDPLIGLQLTNSPTTYRKSYGSYLLSDYTRPDWMVELYVNNVLIDYKRADASGFFSFDVPLVYGSTEVTLRFYGPWGEESSKLVKIDIPTYFVPKNTLEYKITGGVIEDESHSKYSRGDLNYGISRHITVGAGVEYLSSVNSGKIMPFATASFNVANSLVFTGNYTHGVRFKSLLNYRLKSNLQFEVEYAKYDKNQDAINENFIETRKLRVTMPFTRPKFSVYSRFSINQFIYQTTKYINSELMFSINAFGVSTNITTYANFYQEIDIPFVYTNLSMGIRLPRSIYLRPQCQYDWRDNRFISARCELEKRFLMNNTISLSYEENFKNNTRYLLFGLRFNLAFAQASFYTRVGSDDVSFYETASGSLQYESKTGYINATSQSSIGRGGLVMLFFVDINNNGSYEKDEPRISDADIKITGGRITRNRKDTTIIISELEPYTSHLIELNLRNVDNIALRLKDKSLLIEVNSNQLRLIEVPVYVAGEASGMVLMKYDNRTNGLGRILINFYDDRGKLAAQTMSEADGYFSNFELKPGNYNVMIDPDQAKTLNFKSTPNLIPITFKSTIDGDYIDELEFIIEPKE